MNRRDSLKALGVAAGGMLLLDSCDGGEKGTEATPEVEKLPGVTEIEHQRDLRLAKERFFTDHELVTIGVLTDIIIPADDVSPSATEAEVPEFIEFMMKDTPSYQIPIRGGLAWLDAQANKRYGGVFAGCSSQDQLKLVDKIAYPGKVEPGMEPGVTFFHLLRNLTINGFFTSEIGVKDIGYAGNRPSQWDGVPEDVLAEHGFSDQW